MGATAPRSPCTFRSTDYQTLGAVMRLDGGRVFFRSCSRLHVRAPRRLPGSHRPATRKCLYGRVLSLTHGQSRGPRCPGRL